MNFELSEKERDLLDSSWEFSRDVLDDGAAQRIAEHTFDRAVWKKAAEFGYTGLCVPEGEGGCGLNALETMLMVEGFGKGCRDLGLSFSLSAHLFACVMPIYRFGSASLKRDYMPALVSGESIAANAASEPEAGSDIYNMTTKAVKVEGGYNITGQKCFITNAPVADIFLVYAKTHPELGFLGISAFLVPRNTPGLNVGLHRPKDSLSTCTWSEVYFEDMFIPESLRVGDEGVGGAMFHDSMIWERGCLFAAYLGAMDRVLEHVINQVKTREQFGHSLASFQSVTNRIVDMKLRLDASRLLLYRSGWLYDQGRDAEMEIALSKIMISESAVQSGLDAIQVFGGAAIESEMGVMRLLLDAIPSRIFSGTNDIQRNIVARKLGLRSGA